MAIAPLQKPTVLSYCCYVRQAMPLSRYTCSHVVKNTSRSRQETDYTPVSAFLRNSNNKYSCVALKCVVKDHCIVLIVQAAHVNRSSFHIYLKHEIKQEWITMYFISTTERHQYAEFFKFKSTEVNLLSCLICLSGKMADSALLLVRSRVNQALRERSIGLFDDNIEAFCAVFLKPQFFFMFLDAKTHSVWTVP